MFGWFKRLFGSSLPSESAVGRPPVPRGGPIRYQPPITAARLRGSALLGEAHEALLYDSLEAQGRMQYTFLVVVVEKSSGAPVLFVAAEVNEMAAVLGGGSHALGVFDVQGHVNLGFSNDWGDAAKFFPKALAVAALQFGADPKKVQVVKP